MRHQPFRLLALVCAAVWGALAGCQGDGETPASASVTPVAAVIVFGNPDSLFVTDTISLGSTALDSAQHVLVGRAKTWTSTNAAVATVSDTGLVVARSVGFATIVVECGGVTTPVSIKVVPVAVGMIAIATPLPSLLIGETTQAAAVLTDTHGQAIDGRPVLWSSTKPAVATVSATGLVAGIAPGTATVTASSGGKSGSASVTVLTAVAVVSLAPAVPAVPVGKTAQLSVTLRDTGQKVLTGRVVTWSSANPAIASVSASGLLTGVSLGITTITAISEGQSASVVVTTPLAFVALSAGSQHTCGRTADSAVYCWGNNASGRLGDGTTINHSTPTRVATALPFASISAGASHSCALTTSGTPYCWGENFDGELGDATHTGRSIPGVLATAITLKSISSGRFYTCGVSLGGTGYCWGINTNGVLGTGDTVPHITPTPIVGGLTLALVSAGTAHTCASIMFSGTAYCWGSNTRKQLGNDVLTAQWAPSLVSGGFGSFTQIVLGATHTCAVNAFGTDYCWGRSDGGQLGGGEDNDTSTPTPIGIEPGPQTFVISIAAGDNYGCALTGEIEIFCWGANGSGQLGSGSTISTSSAHQIDPPLPSFVAITAGGAHTCGLTYGGVAYCWGDNSFGQLGDATTTRRLVPTLVSPP